MKTTIYYTANVPAGETNDLYIHFIAGLESGWVGIQYEESEEEGSPIELCAQAMAQIIMESSMHEDEKEVEINGYVFWNHTEIDSLNMVEAVASDGETTTFIWKF